MGQDYPGKNKPSIFILALMEGGGGMGVRTGQMPDILDRRWFWLHMTRLCAKAA